jgi:hypothetical protein
VIVFVAWILLNINMINRHQYADYLGRHQR